VELINILVLCEQNVKSCLLKHVHHYPIKVQVCVSFRGFSTRVEASGVRRDIANCDSMQSCKNSRYGGVGDVNAVAQALPFQSLWVQRPIYTQHSVPPHHQLPNRSVTKTGIKLDKCVRLHNVQTHVLLSACGNNVCDSDDIISGMNIGHRLSTSRWNAPSARHTSIHFSVSHKRTKRYGKYLRSEFLLKCFFLKLAIYRPSQCRG
jgi:hypothetical protein